MKKNMVKIKEYYFFIAMIFCLPANVFAVGSAGFENSGFSARTVAQSNAVTARPQDPSTIMSNPAGLVKLKGYQFSAGLQQVDIRTFHRNDVTGDHNQNDMRLLLIPSFYASANFEDAILDRNIAFGVGVNSPFGFKTSYPAVGVGKYTGYNNSLQMVATSISAATELNDSLSVGGGVTHYYVFDYGIDFNYPNSFITGVPGLADGEVKTDLSGHGWGWNVGLLLEPVEKHKFGFFYRSRANIEVNGKGSIEGLILGAAQGFSQFPNFQTAISSNITLPNNFTWAYAYEPSEKWAIEFDLGLTGWHVFADQDVEFENPNAVLVGLGTIPRNYDRTWNIHLGGHYQATEKLDLLGGFAFLQAASPKKHVDNYLPDANRFQWSVGTSYEVNKNLDIDFAYFFQLVASRHISNPQVLAKTGESVDGRYTSIIHGAFLTFTLKFGDDPVESGKS